MPHATTLCPWGACGDHRFLSRSKAFPCHLLAKRMQQKVYSSVCFVQESQQSQQWTIFFPFLLFSLGKKGIKNTRWECQRSLECLAVSPHGIRSESGLKATMVCGLPSGSSLVLLLGSQSALPTFKMKIKYSNAFQLSKQSCAFLIGCEKPLLVWLRAIFVVVVGVLLACWKEGDRRTRDEENSSWQSPWQISMYLVWSLNAGHSMERGTVALEPMNSRINCGHVWIGKQAKQWRVGLQCNMFAPGICIFRLKIYCNVLRKRIQQLEIKSSQNSAPGMVLHDTVERLRKTPRRPCRPTSSDIRCLDLLKPLFKPKEVQQEGINMYQPAGSPPAFFDILWFAAYPWMFDVKRCEMERSRCRWKRRWVRRPWHRWDLACRDVLGRVEAKMALDMSWPRSSDSIILTWKWGEKIIEFCGLRISENPRLFIGPFVAFFSPSTTGQVGRFGSVKFPGQAKCHGFSTCSSPWGHELSGKFELISSKRCDTVDVQ